MCLRSPHNESNFLAETRFFAGSPDSFASFFTKTLAYIKNLLYLCSEFVFNTKNTYLQFVLNTKSTNMNKLLN